MTKQEEIGGTGDVHNCERDGHCLHEGTAVGSQWCCKCLQYVQTLAERLGFYEDRVARMPSVRRARDVRILKYDDDGNFTKEL